MNKTKHETVYIIEPYFDKLSQDALNEIFALTESAGATVYGYKSQLIREITPATFIGKGKLDEIREELASSPVDLIIFDGELSPSQTLNIAEILGVKTIDRTTLILDIFALNATTSEGKLQVELAQLKYIYPRLKGKGQALSQQGAGIGTRGPGETQLETDRRHIKARINLLESQLKELEKRRQLQSERRKKNNVKSIALVGYTNTGKSTLLNRLTGADVLVKNQLFATLDPTIRKIHLEDTEAVLIDTVGFVRNIPHNLVEAFKSTLESAATADLILIVCDASNDYNTQLKTTFDTLDEIGANAEKIVVFNKCDAVSETIDFPKNSVFISAKTGFGVDILLKKINDFFNSRYVKKKGIISYEDFSSFTKIMRLAIVKTLEYLDNGVEVDVTIPTEHYYKFSKFFK